MSAEENKSLTRRVIEGTFNEGNLDVEDGPFARHYLGQGPADAEEIRGPEETRT